MPTAPLPDIFPGEFFVIVWDRDDERFRLELDDEVHSSYDLGSDPNEAARKLLQRGYEKDFREQAVNIAREFGIAQCIPSQQRVLPIFPRSVPPPSLQFEEPRRGWINNL